MANTIIKQNSKNILYHHKGVTNFKGCQCYKDCSCSIDFEPQEYNFYTVKKNWEKDNKSRKY